MNRREFLKSVGISFKSGITWAVLIIAVYFIWLFSDLGISSFSFSLDFLLDVFRLLLFVLVPAFLTAVILVVVKKYMYNLLPAGIKAFAEKNQKWLMLVFVIVLFGSYIGYKYYSKGEFDWIPALFLAYSIVSILTDKGYNKEKTGV